MALEFETFGGVILNVPEDQVGSDNAIYARDVTWDRSLGKIRSRDGFAWLKEAEATGEYKGLAEHSSLRLLATKRVSAESLKLVAIDKEGAEKKETTLNATGGKTCFVKFGTPSAEYTYMRTDTAEQKVVRFDGTNFTEPTATLYENGETEKASGKEMPKAAFMAKWPGEFRMVYANTGAEGGPNKAASSSSHVWFSLPGNAEHFEVAEESETPISSVALNPGDGEEITAVVGASNGVFVFKETYFVRFYAVGTDAAGTPEFLFNNYDLGVGVRMSRPSAELLEETSDQLAVSTVNGVYFCTTDGIYLTTGNEATKISEALHPLEETAPFEGPMAEALDGENESFRWPATGITTIGHDLYVRRYEWMWKYDISLDGWLPWRVLATSFCPWTGLTGGGSEALGDQLPGTVADAAGIGTKAWSNPERAKADDAEYAEIETETSTVSHYLKATGFFEKGDIPEEATIVGAQCKVNRSKAGVGTGLDKAVRMVRGGEVKTTDRSSEEAWPYLEFKTKSYGGSSDLWGESGMTGSNIDSEFGFAIAIEGSGNTMRVNFLTASVYYTLPASGSGVRPRLFVAKGKRIYFTKPGAEDNEGSREPAWQSGRYDAGTPEEKTYHQAVLWGTGTVTVKTAQDFGAVGVELGSEKTFELSEDPATPTRAQKQLSQQTVMSSHRFSGEAPWSVHRLVRYIRSEKGQASQSYR